MQRTATASRSQGAGRNSATTRRRPGARRRREIAEPTPGRRAADLEALSARWQSALDAAGRALGAAGEYLPGPELRERRVALARETELTARALRELARGGREPAPWLSPSPVTNRMLGLPSRVRACVFDVEGVLTDSSRLHAWAWGQVFDDYLARLSEKTGWQLVPFDRRVDYHACVEGRSRLDGVQTFLRSRGIHIPLGHPDDRSSVETAFGLARRKGELLERRLLDEGVSTLPGARRYLEAARRAGLPRAVVYESASTLPMLEQAGIASLIDTRIDAAVIGAEALRSRPAPDLLLSACHHLGTAPEDVVTFTGSPAGVVAGVRAGMLTVAVADDALCETLQGFGAELAVASLGSLLDASLRPAVTDGH